MELLTWICLAVAALGAWLLVTTFGLRRAASRLERQAWRALAASGRAADTGAPDDGARWFYLRPGDVPRGPVGLTALCAMVADGRLAPETLAAPAGKNDWRPLGTLIAEAHAGRCID